MVGVIDKLAHLNKKHTGTVYCVRNTLHMQSRNKRERLQLSTNWLFLTKGNNRQRKQHYLSNQYLLISEETLQDINIISHPRVAMIHAKHYKLNTKMDYCWRQTKRSQ